MRLKIRSPRGLYHVSLLKTLWFIAFQVFFILLQYSTAFSGDGLKWGRFRFTPELSVSEAYTDNVYIAPTDEQSDTVTTIFPKLLIDFAIAPRNYFSLCYEGDFRMYAHSDNFKKDIHHLNIFWNLTTAKGSIFKIGARANLDSIQPYSVEDRHKDYEEKQAYADILVSLGAFTDVGIKYDHDDCTFILVFLFWYLLCASGTLKSISKFGNLFFLDKII